MSGAMTSFNGVSAGENEEDTGRREGVIAGEKDPK
jgi:hypothetical protein